MRLRRGSLEFMGFSKTQFYHDIITGMERQGKAECHPRLSQDQNLSKSVVATRSFAKQSDRQTGDCFPHRY
jgi:hypothetical protein